MLQSIIFLLELGREKTSKLHQILHACAFFSGCAAVGTSKLNELYGESLVRNRAVSAESEAGQNYYNKVKPVLDYRCVSCHACYDAPCQLKLSSTDGIDRGASKEVVYDASRLIAADPTRIFIDAASTEAWREKNFHPVMNERDQTHQTNLDASVLFQILELKKKNPLPSDKLLDESFRLGLTDKRECAKIEAFDEYANDYPLWGMPYGMPGLTNDESSVLEDWLADGAPLPELKPLSKEHQSRIDDWETFLNGDSLKQQLASRYIYEHLFVGNIYFDDLPVGEYFSLVRSSTPPGEKINIIATRRPYDNPGVERVYYRLQRQESSVVSKIHMPYALGEKRKQLIIELFFKPIYSVSELPGYEEKNSANPFMTFTELPAISRYRFMLEEAEFTIMGFIKGPVCRGQTALSVIDDHFWVFFETPHEFYAENLDDFLQDQGDNLRLPASTGSTSSLLINWARFSGLQHKYLKAKKDLIEETFPNKISLDLNLIWDGNGENGNAALTVFRHFDSATVVKGMVGPSPKTAWLIGYPVLERIHYLLISGYDVFGDVGHQFNTRVYMDFMRMESESNFLALLPEFERVRQRNYWYRDASDKAKQHVWGSWSYINATPQIDYKTSEPKQELFDMIGDRLASVLNDQYSLSNNQVPAKHRAVLRSLNELKGENATALPETAVLMIDDISGKTHLYTVLRNSARSNITTMLKGESNRLPSEDYITILRGVVGSYPNAIWNVSDQELDSFVSSISKIQNEADYARFLDSYGVRRTSPDFWQHNDKLHQSYQKQAPREYGILDYNRLENR